MAIKFGRYELLSRVSVGGMAEVYRGRVSGAAGFEKIVAIKRILPQLSDDQEFIGMFIDEAKISANLNHSNIGQVFEFGRIEDRYFIAMEFIHGRDVRAIQSHFRSQGELMPIPMAIRIVLEVCNALEYAHSKRDTDGEPLNIVHRDVSPQNILISFEGAVKLIDFGIAKALSRSNATATGSLKGKFDYMSPEQVEGESVDHRSDLFALGTVLWELVAGRQLFRGDNELATLEHVRKAEIELPSSLNPSVPRALEQIIIRALSKDRERRYQRAEEMHEELERFAQSHRMTFSTKQLSRWMKATFSQEQRGLKSVPTVADDSLSPAPPRSYRRKPARATMMGFGAPPTAPPPRPTGPARPTPSVMANLRASVLSTPKRKTGAPTAPPREPAGLPRGPRPPVSLKPDATPGDAPIFDDDSATELVLDDARMAELSVLEKPIHPPLRQDEGYRELPKFEDADPEATLVSEESQQLASTMDVPKHPAGRPDPLAPEPVLGDVSARELEDQSDTILQSEFEKIQSGGDAPREVVVYPHGGGPGGLPVDPNAPTIAPGQLNVADLRLSPPPAAPTAGAGLPGFSDDGPTTVDESRLGSGIGAVPTVGIDEATEDRHAYISEETKPVMGPPPEPAGQSYSFESFSEGRPPDAPPPAGGPFGSEAPSQVTSPFQGPARVVSPPPEEQDAVTFEPAEPSEQVQAGEGVAHARATDDFFTTQAPEAVESSEVIRRRWILIVILGSVALVVAVTAVLLYVLVVRTKAGDTRKEPTAAVQGKGTAGEGKPKTEALKPKPKAEPKPASKPKPRAEKPKPRPRPRVPYRRQKPGYLLVSSKPWARIYVNDKPTNRNTPTPPSQPLVLQPGTHRITLEAGGKRFTFPVVIRSGETSKLIKTLRVNR